MLLRNIVGDGVNIIAGADPDPNTAPPPAARISNFASLYPGGGLPCPWLSAEGGAPTVEVWCLQDFPDGSSRWFRWNNTTYALPAADQMVPLSPAQFPVSLSGVFLRVTVVGGATRVTLGLTA